MTTYPHLPTFDAPELDRLPVPIGALLRHFGDLRDRNHFGEYTRQGKESAFEQAVRLLAAPARQVLDEFNTHLLLGTGSIRETGLHRDDTGGLLAAWLLTWPEQERSRVQPISLIAHYGAGFHHPHLRGATITEWPLNVATQQHADELVPLLRAIAAADLHNFVFQLGGDWRLVPATVARADKPATLHGDAATDRGDA